MHRIQQTQRGYIFDDELARLNLKDISTAFVWRFCFKYEALAMVHVHPMPAEFGDQTLKATCKQHVRCGLLITKGVQGLERYGLLMRLCEWGARGRGQTRDVHQADARALHPTTEAPPSRPLKVATSSCTHFQTQAGVWPYRSTVRLARSVGGP